MVWVLTILIMALIVFIWILGLRHQFGQNEGDDKKNLFQAIQETIKEKDFGSSIRQIKEVWNQDEDQTINPAGFENKLEDSAEPVEINEQTVEQIEQKLQQYQNKVESNESKFE